MKTTQQKFKTPGVNIQTGKILIYFLFVTCSYKAGARENIGSSI